MYYTKPKPGRAPSSLLLVISVHSLKYLAIIFLISWLILTKPGNLHCVLSKECPNYFQTATSPVILIVRETLPPCVTEINFHLYKPPLQRTGPLIFGITVYFRHVSEILFFVSQKRSLILFRHIKFYMFVPLLTSKEVPKIGDMFPLTQF